MCGLIGIIENKKIDQAKFFDSFEMLKHRGPDHQAYHHTEDEHIYIGHTRLAIVDLDKRSNQPMINEQTRTKIVYNGEIYNYIELRKELESVGIKFTTDGDTEVFLKAYDYWGPEFVKKMNGFFSAIIIDEKKKRTIVYRDRMGIKPLYFYKDNECFMCSSEIKPILNYLGNYEMNLSNLHYYFSYRYNMGSETLFKNIMKVEPATYIILQENALSIHKYWDIEKIKRDIVNEKVATSLFDREFSRSVTERSKTTDLTGLYLSAGVDSNAIAAYIPREEQNVESFSIGFDREYDETKQIKKSVEQFNIKANFYNIETEDFKEYEKAIFYLEEPLGDSIILPTLKLSEQASKKCNVCLSGEGADEILNGYVHHVSLFKEERVLKIIPNSLHGLIPYFFKILPMKLLNKIFPYPSDLGKSGVVKLLNHLKSLGRVDTRIDSIINLFYGDELSKFFNEKVTEARNNHELYDYINKNSNRSFMDILTLCDLKFWNTNYTLHRLDRLNMANSVEARVPFMDHRVVETSLRISPYLNIKNNTTKSILRNALKLHGVDKEIINRPKAPFYYPLRELADEKYEELISKYLTSEKLAKVGIFNVKNILSLRTSGSGGLIEEKRIFIIIVFMQWYELYFSQEDLLKKYREYQGHSDRKLWSNKLTYV